MFPFAKAERQYEHVNIMVSVKYPYFMIYSPYSFS